MPASVPCNLPDDFIRNETLRIFKKRPCLFQIRLCKAQLERRNIPSIAATGSGKTLTYLMTLAFSLDSVLILVTALNVLGDQFVREAESVGYAAVFVNAENDNDVTFSVCLLVYTLCRPVLSHASEHTIPQIPTGLHVPRNPHAAGRTLYDHALATQRFHIETSYHRFRRGPLHSAVG